MLFYKKRPHRHSGHGKQKHHAEKNRICHTAKSQRVFYIERNRGHNQRHGRAVKGIGKAENPEFRIGEQIPESGKQTGLLEILSSCNFVASKRTVKDDGYRQDSINNAGQAIAQGIRYKRCKGNTDDHGEQLKSLTHGIGFGPLGIRGKQLGKKSAVVGIDQGIQSSGEDIHKKHIGKNSAAA